VAAVPVAQKPVVVAPTPPAPPVTQSSQPQVYYSRPQPMPVPGQPMRTNAGMSNPAAERIKAVGSSPLMLITCIVALASVISGLITLIPSLQVQFSQLADNNASIPGIIFTIFTSLFTMLPCIGLWVIFGSSKKALKKPGPYKIPGTGYIRAYAIVYLILFCILLVIVTIACVIILFTSSNLGAEGGTMVAVVIVTVLIVLSVILVVIYYAKISGFLGNAKRTALYGARVRGAAYVVVANFIIAFFLIIGTIIKYLVTEVLINALAQVADYLWSYFEFNLYQYVTITQDPLAIVSSCITVVFLICVSLLIMKYKRNVKKAFTTITI